MVYSTILFQRALSIGGQDILLFHMKLHLILPNNWWDILSRILSIYIQQMETGWATKSKRTKLVHKCLGMQLHSKQWPMAIVQSGKTFGSRLPSNCCGVIRLSHRTLSLTPSRGFLCRVWGRSVAQLESTSNGSSMGSQSYLPRVSHPRLLVRFNTLLDNGWVTRGEGLISGYSGRGATCWSRIW